MATIAAGTLQKPLTELRALGIVPNIAAELQASGAPVHRQLVEAMLTEIPALSMSGNPGILPELEEHAARHVTEICRLFAGGEPGPFEFVAGHAEMRAEQRFPLELVLHCYRCGHWVLSAWIRTCVAAAAPGRPDRAISAVADFAIEYTDAVSSRATAAYVEHTRRLAVAEGDSRGELLRLLLAGYDESNGRINGLLKRGGYLDQRQAYAVVAALPVNPAEMDNAPRAERLTSALAGALAATPLRTLAGQDDRFAVAVVCGRRRQSGWSPVQDPVSGRTLAALNMLGPAVVVGVSSDQPSTVFIPRALQEAKVALHFAGTDRRVVQFADLSLQERLLHNALDGLQSAPPSWVNDLAAANEKAGGALTMTLQAMADANLNVQAAARNLGKHPNTVYARIERIRQITGLDAQSYHGLSELQLAAACWRMQRHQASTLPANPARV